MIDWNAYRAAYPSMSYAEVAAFHRLVWERHPDQRHYSEPHLAAFFVGSLGLSSVLEVGGWQGEAAAQILTAHPEIVHWDNFEICEDAALRPVTDDPRYRATFADRWPWELALSSPHETAVLAHVIEHMLPDQLSALIRWLAGNGVRRAYVEAPLREDPHSWRNSTSAHVLEIGWRAVIDLFAGSGFVLADRHLASPDHHVLIFGRQP